MQSPRRNPSAPVAREIKSGQYIVVMPPFTNDQLVGIPRVINHRDEMVIPPDSSVVPMLDNRNQKILPFVNEIVTRVKNDMKSYGFVDSGAVSYDSIPKLQSGFRSLATQQDLFNKALREAGGNRAVARGNVADPSDGPTPHMTGRAVDFNLLVPNTREIKTSPLENRIKMWNTRKWKVLNFLLTHKYKAMNYEREPWHYEFGKASERNLDAIKRLEAQGKIIGNPKLPAYLEKEVPGFDMEAARNYNDRKQTPLPYKPEFDVGSADFAFYIAGKQKDLNLSPVDGKMGPATYNTLVQDANRGASVPPVVTDMSNLPPTQFDIDKAFDFGGSQEHEPVEVPFRRGAEQPSQAELDAQRQREANIRRREEEIRRQEDQRRAREAEQQRARDAEQQRAREAEQKRAREAEQKRAREAEQQRARDAKAKEEADAKAKEEQQKIKSQVPLQNKVGGLSSSTWYMLAAGLVVAGGVAAYVIKGKGKPGARGRGKQPPTSKHRMGTGQASVSQGQAQGFIIPKSTPAPQGFIMPKPASAPQGFIIPKPAPAPQGFIIPKPAPTSRGPFITKK